MADLDQTPQNGTLSAENANINLLQCRVYIAGILLPTISVNIRCVFNEPPTAEIALSAYPELFSLGEADRVPCTFSCRRPWWSRRTSSCFSRDSSNPRST